MTLIDTSAWIEFFRGRSPLADKVDALLETKQAALCGPVVTELRRGFRSLSDANAVLPLLTACHLLPQPPELWDEAGQLGYLLARAGVTSRSFDLLIATYAVAHSVPLLTADRDFAKMQKVVDLMLA